MAAYPAAIGAPDDRICNLRCKCGFGLCLRCLDVRQRLEIRGAGLHEVLGPLAKLGKRRARRPLGWLLLDLRLNALCRGFLVSLLLFGPAPRPPSQTCNELRL